ncbi:hypothetical protein LCGC14_0102220 [marine sediment metagenome]|uniref:Uncharacterized protein n=1 Tax=marine sediment metagenome TaxID=412755 RepID=A0A0F9VS94_9ZZZZ
MPIGRPPDHQNTWCLPMPLVEPLYVHVPLLVLISTSSGALFCKLMKLWLFGTGARKTKFLLLYFTLGVDILPLLVLVMLLRIVYKIFDISQARGNHKTKSRGHNLDWINQNSGCPQPWRMASYFVGLPPVSFTPSLMDGVGWPGLTRGFGSNLTDFPTSSVFNFNLNLIFCQ